MTFKLEGCAVQVPIHRNPIRTCSPPHNINLLKQECSYYRALSSLIQALPRSTARKDTGRGQHICLDDKEGRVKQLAICFAMSTALLTWKHFNDKNGEIYLPEGGVMEIAQVTLSLARRRRSKEAARAERTVEHCGRFALVLAAAIPERERGHAHNATAFAWMRGIGRGATFARVGNGSEWCERQVWQSARMRRVVGYVSRRQECLRRLIL